MKKKHRNQFISRLLAMCLAAVMMLSMGITASAANITSNTERSFAVTGFDTNSDPTVTAYQIITVNIDDAAGQPEYPMYTWAGPVATWLTGNNYGSYVDSKLGTNAVANAFANNTVSAADMTKFLEKLAAAIKANANSSFSGLKSFTGTVNNGTASFQDMPLGVYLIIASGGVKIYKPTTVKLVPEYDSVNKTWDVGTAVVGDGKAESNVKGTAPQIKKSVFKINDIASTDRTTAIGDTVTFKLEADVPDYPEGAKKKTFIISDTVGTGLAYQNGTVEVYSDSECKDPIDSTLYEVTETNATVPDSSKTKRTFVIEFNEDFFKAQSVPEKVYVTYNAKVTSDAFTDNTNGVLDNDAYLGYSNNPYDSESYTERNDKETVYTYAIDLTKVKTDGEAIITDTATFELKSDSTPLYFTGNNGVYTHDSSITSATEDYTTALTTSSTGRLTLRGLDTGTYTLTETEAPDGYVLPNGSITIKITDADAENDGPNGTIDKDQDGNVVASGGAEIYVEDDAPGDGVTINDTTISFEVVNKTADQGAFTLPVTGGAGTVIFTMAGILLMGGAVALLVVVLRRKRS